MSFSFSTSIPFLSLCMTKVSDRFCLISSTLFMASSVFSHNSLSYFTGTFLLWANSKAGSTVSSFPWALRYALVHLVLRGFFFCLNSLWHLERQNLNTWKNEKKKPYTTYHRKVSVRNIADCANLLKHIIRLRMIWRLPIFVNFTSEMKINFWHFNTIVYQRFSCSRRICHC